MENRILSNVFGYMFATMVLLFIITQTVIFATFFMPFFEWQFERPREYRPFNGRNAVETIGIEKGELMRVTVELLDYMRGRRDTLDGIQAVVMGENREFFSDLEKRHMIDVRFLYDWVFRIRTFSISYVFVSVFILFAIKHERFPVSKKYASAKDSYIRLTQTALKSTRAVIIGFLSVAAITTIVIATDFARAWDFFHVIFFNNDYWILTHRVDLLLDMVSLSFFLHISIMIGGIILAAGLLVIVLSTILLKYFGDKK